MGTWSATAAAVLACALVAGAPAAGQDWEGDKIRIQQVDPGGGNDFDFSIKVTNGEIVPPGIYPDVVRITFFKSNSATVPSICTGFKITGLEVVLTAGHCSCGVLTSYRFLSKGMIDSTTSNPEERSRVTFRALREPVRFPGYDCASPGAAQPGRDLALFFMQSLDTDHVGQVYPEVARQLREPPSGITHVASMHSVYAAGVRQLVASGYGRMETGAFPTDLRRGFIDIASHFCSRGVIAGTQCAGFREFSLGTVSAGSTQLPVDTCDGDSGGPVFWYPPERIDERTNTPFYPPPALVGITSRALLFADHLPGILCGGGGIYTAVGHSDVVNWLWSWGLGVRTVELDAAPPPPR